MLIPLAYAGVTQREARQLAAFNTDLEAALSAAQHEQRRAEEHFGIAREAILDIVARIGAKELPKTPYLQVVRADVLGSSRALYERLYAERPRDIEVLRDLLSLTQSHVKALHELGRERESMEALDEFDALVQQLDGQGEDPWAVHAHRARAAYIRCISLSSGLRHEAALEQNEIVLREAPLALAHDPDHLDTGMMLAHALSSRAGSLGNLDRTDESLEYAIKAQVATDRLLALGEPPLKLLNQAGGIFASLAGVAARAGRYELGTEYAERAMEIAGARSYQGREEPVVSVQNGDFPGRSRRCAEVGPAGQRTCPRAFRWGARDPRGALCALPSARPLRDSNESGQRPVGRLAAPDG